MLGVHSGSGLRSCGWKGDTKGNLFSIDFAFHRNTVDHKQSKVLNSVADLDPHESSQHPIQKNPPDSGTTIHETGWGAGGGGGRC
jgi:hypothetical protein